MKKQILLTLAISLAFAVAASAQSESSLVQASKQKSTDKKAKRVFTNDDYPERPDLAPATATASASSPAAAGKDADPGKNGVAANPAATPGEAKPDEKKVEVPETKQAELERKLDTSKREEQELRQKLDKLQEKANNETDENRRNMYLDIISNQQTTLSEYRHNQENLQKQIEDEKNKDKKSE